MDYNEEVQYQSWPRMLNQKHIQPCNQRGFPLWICWRVAQHKCWSETRVSTIPYTVQCLLKRIITDELDSHIGTVSIRDRQLTKFRFADDIDGLVGSETELQQLVSRMERTSEEYGMEIGNQESSPGRREKLTQFVQMSAAVQSRAGCVFLNESTYITPIHHSPEQHIVP